MAGNMKVGIGGLGAIGLTVARAITDGRLPGLELGAVSARDLERAKKKLASIGASAPVVPLKALAETCDVVVECAPAAAFPDVADAAIAKGRIFVPVSIGALLNHLALVEKAKETHARLVLPTGALIGLDAVRAAAEGIIKSVTLETRKPPLGLGGAPYLVENDISVEGLTEAKKVFAGNARAAAKGFPANVNVAAALSLAGIGPEQTSVEIWADPSVTRNTHTIRVEADSAHFTMMIENIPTEENPKTGKITALSVIATLRRLNAPLTAGT